MLNDKPKYFETSPEFAELVRRAYETDAPEEIVGYINGVIYDAVSDERSELQIKINTLESEAAALEKKLDQAESDIAWLNDELKETELALKATEEREREFSERIKELTP